MKWLFIAMVLGGALLLTISARGKDPDDWLAPALWFFLGAILCVSGVIGLMVT